MTTKHPDLPGAELLYEGRTLHIQVLVNTDEPMHEVAARIQAAAKGPKKVMATVLGAELDAAGAVDMWQVIWRAAAARKPEKP